MDYSDAPQVLRDFLIYHETICGHSKATVDQYYLDLRMFLRFLKLDRGLAPRTAELDEISIADVDLSFLRAVTLTEVYSFLAYLSRDRVRQPNAHEPEYGLSASSRARKIAAIRSFFKYLTVKAKLLEENPVQDLDSPKIPKTLPHYLTLEESKRLLSVVDGKNKERDYCILCIFLNCGLRISELVGLNLQDDHGDSLRILGKGSKERVVYLNDACREALDRYLAVRKEIAPPRTTANGYTGTARSTRTPAARQTCAETLRNHCCPKRTASAATESIPPSRYRAIADTDRDHRSTHDPSAKPPRPFSRGRP